MQPRTIGGMAAIEDRSGTLETVVNSIAPQLDILYVYLNDFDSIPDFFQGMSNVKPILGKDAQGDLNANGKMVFLGFEGDGVAFTLDDDIVYPNDYVSRLLNELEKYDFRAGCAVHGSFVHDAAVWYYERSFVAAMKQARNASEIVNLVGSGTTAFPVREMRGFDMEGPVWVDLQISLRLLRSGCPLILVPRSREWLKPLKYDGLYQRYIGEISHHTLRLHEWAEWREDDLRRLWREVLERVERKGGRGAVRHLGLGPTSRAFIDREEQGHTVFGRIAMKKVSEFASLWGEKTGNSDGV